MNIETDNGMGAEDFDDGLDADDQDFDGQDPAGGGDPAQTVLEKFGNDPAKLALSYSELQSALGRQGNELGEIRRQLAALNEKSENEGEAGGGELYGDVDDLISELESKAEAGENIVAPLVRALFEKQKAATEKISTEVKTTNAQAQLQRGVEEFKARHNVTPEIDAAMGRIYKENPALLPLNGGPEAIKRGIGMLYREARFQLRAGGNRSAPLDSGRSVRTRRGGQTNDAAYQQAYKRAAATGDVRDIRSLLEYVALE